MNRLLRRSTLALLAAACLVLTGCAGTAEDTSSPSGATDGVRGELTVYAAASLAGAFDAIGEAFMAENPDVRFRPVYDGSSTLVTQILEGAPADVFASADEANMDKAADVVAEPALFASNTLVIVVPSGNPGDVEALADLADVTTVLCAPEVPCGAASATLLSAAEVTVDPASLEQNVSAVLTKVAASEADAGLVYATDVIGRDDVEVIVPDGADEVVNHYPIAVLSDAPNATAAEAFVAFVRADAGRSILADFGFGAP
ncbi:molybdate ABC transporter substrate-binding protein [Microbacterium sp. KSW4-16]|uniref:molybdate ABC transporter substrate-binding protein n=1 Tax=Microbacterium TaxID=33882 RepID=UPI00103FEC66|nr:MULTISPECIES: molybdate ABC transporter substrate-binding protein [Microbacterium]MCK8467360.1 molybdate ABC transporter substrate-binding protein [Microbacterium aurugineum]QEA28255.1 molybdate ABC transporter substrate-binding protein [Microbacterium sp. CBA3102]TCJ24227.1 molybdate ABC transporter substrate-binding protein [Microbacterium sp. PI-1]